uniref:Uncharacterized protein n=1 Tax=Romanomermis culicivorax TaxID=13658 RepID=A0A915J2C3_ROMCU
MLTKTLGRTIHDPFLHEDVLEKFKKKFLNTNSTVEASTGRFRVVKNLHLQQSSPHRHDEI